MANIFSNPWDEERQRKLRSPFTGVRPYQPSLSPGGAYGQIWDGNTGMGLMPGPSTPPGGPAPLPPNMQPDYGGGQNPDPRYRPMIPENEYRGEIPGTQQPVTGPVTPPQLIHPGIPQGPINLPGRGGGYSGGQWEGLDMSGFNPTGPQTTDMTPYTINGETYYGSSSWLGKLEEYLNSTGQGDAFGRPDTSIGFQQPRQGPPDTKFSPPGPPGHITPLPSPPNAGTGGPLPPGGGINRPSRPSNPPDYRLARPDPGIGRPNLPDMGHIKPVPLQGQGYNRATTSSASPSPAWAVNKTKRTF